MTFRHVLAFKSEIPLVVDSLIICSDCVKRFRRFDLDVDFGRALILDPPEFAACKALPRQDRKPGLILWSTKFKGTAYSRLAPGPVATSPATCEWCENLTNQKRINPMATREDEFESVGQSFPSLLNLFTKETADKGGGQMTGIFEEYKGVDKPDPDVPYNSDNDPEGKGPAMLHYDFFTFKVESVTGITQDSKGNPIKPGDSYTISATGHLRYLLNGVIKNQEQFAGRKCRITHQGKVGKMSKGKFKGHPCHQYDVAWAKKAKK